MTMKSAQQASLPIIFESFEDAIGDVVRALGGAKRVGPLLWQGMDTKKAERKLLDCLNEERDHKLSPDEIIRLSRWGRDVGCHAIAQYFCDRTGYMQPEPVHPEDEKAELQRRTIEAVGYLRGLTERLEALK